MHCCAFNCMNWNMVAFRVQTSDWIKFYWLPTAHSMEVILWPKITVMSLQWRNVNTLVLRTWVTNGQTKKYVLWFDLVASLATISWITRSHPEMVGDMSCVLELWPIKNPFCAFLARVETYTHTRNWTCTFSSSHLRAVTDANDDDDNTRHHSTTISPIIINKYLI